MGKRIVIALGGNALGSTPYEQLALVTETAKPIVDLIEQGNEVVIAHGNGPQVGMINLGMATAAEAGAIKSDMPFPECGAMSQGYIGYHLQNAIGNELAARGLQKDVATVVTQVLVDENDPAFRKPTKPVGAFYDKATAERIAAEKGYTMVAVIDKDFASAKLAELVQADALVILTAVDRVCINWGKPDQKSLAEMTVAEAERYCEEGHFAPGSMLPKVRAAVSFAKTGGQAIIASLAQAGAAVRGEAGTVVHL